MTDVSVETGTGPAYERLRQLLRRIEALPVDAHDLVDETPYTSGTWTAQRERLLSHIEGLMADLERDHLLQQTIMEQTVTHLAYLDREFNYIRANSAYARGVRRRVEELIGRNHFELFPHSENRPIFEEARETGDPAEFWAMPVQFPDQPKRGTTYWDWSLVPVKNRQGMVQGLIISSTEVTERVQLRRERERLRMELRRYSERLEDLVARRTAALRASEARFRTIFEDSVLGITLLDAKGRVAASNPALRNLLGYREEELDGSALAAYGHPDDAEVDRDLFASLVTGRLGFYQVQKRYLRKDGGLRWVELTVSRVKRTGENDRRLAVAILEDITEKRINQEALLRAERLAIAGRLGTSLAHEINNPLQSVIGCLGLAEEMLEDGAEVRPYLKMAMEELERAAGIVSQLRDLGREATATKEPADLNTLVEKSLLLTGKRCQNQGVEVVWSPATDLPSILLVPDRMQQVFLNIVLNAVDAMPGGGQLRVSTALTDQPPGVRVRFADSGMGIKADSLPQLFEPFYSTRPEGLGLGLYISKSIVDEHGGHIDVESRAGEGTTFTVWLPR